MCQNDDSANQMLTSWLKVHSIVDVTIPFESLCNFFLVIMGSGFYKQCGPLGQLTVKDFFLVFTNYNNIYRRVKIRISLCFCRWILRNYVNGLWFKDYSSCSAESEWKKKHHRSLYANTYGVMMYFVLPIFFLSEGNVQKSQWTFACKDFQYVAEKLLGFSNYLKFKGFCFQITFENISVVIFVQFDKI